MHLYKTLLAAVTLLLSASAAGYEAEQASGWRGPGFYTIASRATGTVVDLYLGGREDGTPVYGWYVLGVLPSSFFGNNEALNRSLGAPVSGTTTRSG